MQNIEKQTYKINPSACNVFNFQCDYISYILNFDRKYTEMLTSIHSGV
jgi:hypothetical protein